jgi:ABC-type spermidine/putrescine transport system permease subunit II
MWPQWTFIILLIFETGFTLAKHGEPRTDYSFWETLFNSAIIAVLLYFGGFFKGIF